MECSPTEVERYVEDVAPYILQGIEETPPYDLKKFCKYDKIVSEFTADVVYIGEGT